MSYIRLLSVIIVVALLAVVLLPATRPAFSQVIIPDGIAFVDGPATLESGGRDYVINLQVTFRGANHSGSYLGIFLRTSDPSLVQITDATSILSDWNGRASFNITTGEGYGNATITASLLKPDGSIQASKTFIVTAYGNVTGIVIDSAGRPVPGAAVTLYGIINGEKGPALQAMGNPATATGEGTYAFERVPYGPYVIEAAIDGYNGSANLTVSGQNQSMPVIIPGYIAPTPTPEPTAAPTGQPSPTATPVPAGPSPGAKTPTGDTSRQFAWIVAIALALAAILIGVQWLRERKRKK